jgi:putative transposase
MTNPFRYFNSSPEVIRLVVMMYVRYPLSLRNVEDLLAERGIDISYETVRFWWNRFGPMFAAEIRKKRVAHMRGYTQWRWHVDEVFVKVNGALRYLWRAVDHEGEVLEAVVTAKRDKAAALKLLKRIMKRYGPPQSVVTDGLWAYSAAMDEIGAADRHEVGRHLNNRAENSHQPFRRRERAMQRFRSMKTLQKFSSVHAQLHNHFNQERNLVTREISKLVGLHRIARLEIGELDIGRALQRLEIEVRIDWRPVGLAEIAGQGDAKRRAHCLLPVFLLAFLDFSAAAQPSRNLPIASLRASCSTQTSPE